MFVGTTATSLFYPRSFPDCKVLIRLLQKIKNEDVTQQPGWNWGFNFKLTCEISTSKVTQHHPSSGDVSWQAGIFGINKFWNVDSLQNKKSAFFNSKPPIRVPETPATRDKGAKESERWDGQILSPKQTTVLRVPELSGLEGTSNHLISTPFH